MNNKKQFRIIALRPLRGCKSHILKVLKEDTTYFFYEDYENDPDKKDCIRKKGNGSYLKISEDFFSTSPFINISAIVGKNGDGKSTIVELMMMILNNLAFVSGFVSYQFSLKPVYDVYAIIYYEIGNNIYTIKSEGNLVRLSCSNGIYDISKDPEKDKTKLKNIEEFLFYTQISNYSLYAYNAKEFIHGNESAENSWINGIFHKNDGYQTPIVLNPWRDNGNIDVNKENSLTKDRLVSLFIESDDFRTINHKQCAELLTYSLWTSSKLDDVSIYDFFQNTQTSKVADTKFEDKFKIKKLQRKINTSTNKLLSELIAALDLLRQFIQKEKNLIERAIKIKQKLINDIRNERKEDSNWQPEETDIQLIAELLDHRIHHLNPSLPTLYKEIESVGELNSTQFMHVVLIACYRDEWENYFRESMKIDSESMNKALDYLIYKSIAIVEKNYTQFREYNKRYLFIDFISNKKVLDSIRINCANVINKINEDNSHVTLKMRQTLNFMRLNSRYNYIDLSQEKITLEEYRQKLDEINKENKLSIIELLPPPIFATDIKIKQKENNSYSSLSELSSGERQELNSISSIIYHLKNVNSIASEEQLIKYKYINLILEEIELYFHPEYQRRFINRLIEQIYKSKLTDIESINICFVTHSPFILSDIPNANILRLNKGNVINENFQTFGANIHDLLANKFFMEEGFIGEFAKRKIRSAIDYMISYKKNELEKTNKKDEWTKEKMKNFIKQIGEPLIKNELNDMYLKTFIEPDIEEIQKEIDRLTVLKEEKQKK